MNSYDIVRRPIISERSMTPVFDREGNEIKKYTFEVAKSANKIQIKKAVEEIFKVKVQNVTTINYMGKTKRMGVHIGKRADWKKAVVKLTADSKTIDIFEN